MTANAYQHRHRTVPDSTGICTWAVQYADGDYALGPHGGLVTVELSNAHVWLDHDAAVLAVARLGAARAVRARP